MSGNRRCDASLAILIGNPRGFRRPNGPLWVRACGGLRRCTRRHRCGRCCTARDATQQFGNARIGRRIGWIESLLPPRGADDLDRVRIERDLNGRACLRRLGARCVRHRRCCCRDDRNDAQKCKAHPATHAAPPPHAYDCTVRGAQISDTSRRDAHVKSVLFHDYTGTIVRGHEQVPCVRHGRASVFHLTGSLPEFAGKSPSCKTFFSRAAGRRSTPTAQESTYLNMDEFASLRTRPQAVKRRARSCSATRLALSSRPACRTVPWRTRGDFPAGCLMDLPGSTGLPLRRR
jgi:hypothetical protein